MRTLKAQLLSVAEEFAFLGPYGQEYVQFRYRIQEHVCAPITNSQHQRRFAVVCGHNRMGGEDELGPWPREPDKGQSCQNSCEA